MKQVCLTMCMAAMPLLAQAQLPRGAGVTTLNGDSVSMTFVRARVGEDDQTEQRLKAIVIFAGRPGWTSGSPGSGPRLREREDSVKKASPDGAMLGVVVTDKVIAHVAYQYSQ